MSGALLASNKCFYGVSGGQLCVYLTGVIITSRNPVNAVKGNDHVSSERHLKLIDMPCGENAVLSMLKQMVSIVTTRPVV
jgi:hypothetical protein